ncbi:MAG: methionyl-tRNA formyltransferase [Gammaproteobacteria bacterium]|nr:methionyl-tRNA formyltransferase [Gammaproteobacteria bacterium]
MTQPGLRIGFAGTPELAAAVLARVLDSHQHVVTRVFTQPDRPAGRGRHLTSSPVKRLALDHGIPIEQPQQADEFDRSNRLRDADVLLVVAFGLLLPERTLTLPRLGAINVHTSLLPRWRGAAPIQRAIEAGDSESGITIMRMDAGLDSGPVLLQERCPIRADDTSASLHDRLAHLGAECALRSLNLLAARMLTATPQDSSLATYARKISKHEARINWHAPAGQTARTVRAFNPWPVCHTVFAGNQLRIWRAEGIGGAPPAILSAPGTICDISAAGVDVATGDGLLRLTEMQLPGRKPAGARDFVNARYDWLRPGVIAG